jgi:hypothetical protein
MKPKADLRFPHEAGWTALAEIGAIPEKPSNRDCFRRLLSVLVCPTLLTSNSLFQRRANNETLPCACGSGWRPPKKLGATMIEMLITTTFVIFVALVIAMLMVRQ